MGKGDGDLSAGRRRRYSPALEVELTLGGDRAALDRVVGAPRFQLPGGEESAQRLRSTYYDTGDFRLRRRGFTLRIREDGERLGSDPEVGWAVFGRLKCFETQ